MMPIQFAGNCPTHSCIDSLEYKQKIEINIKRSESSKAIKKRWKGRIGDELTTCTID